MLAGLAAVTRRVELAPLVTCTGYRNPALLAKIADAVDMISGGRLILALGSGWNDPEFRAFGFPMDHKYARFEEALTIIRGLLREGAIDFEGTYYRAPRLRAAAARAARQGHPAHDRSRTGRRCSA